MQTTWSPRVGYRSVVADPPAELIEACGNHRVILVKSLDQTAEYGGDWFAVKQYARQHGLSDAEAIKQANACLVEQERIMADRRLRRSAAEPRLSERVVRIMPGAPVASGTESQS